MNNQYKPKIDSQPNPDFEEINQWEIQPEYLPSEQDSPFNQDVNIEKDALQEAKDLYFGYLLDGKNLSEEEKFLILEEFTGSDILLGECYLRIFDRIDLSQIDSEMMDCLNSFSKSGSTDYDSFIHSIVDIAGKNNIDIEGLVLSNFPNTRLLDGFDISWEVDNNNNEITEKVETIARKKFNDFCNNPKDSYLSCDVFRGSICEMYEQNIESCFNSLSEEQEKEIFDVVYNKIDELCFDESGNEKSFSDVVNDKFSNLRFIKEDKIFDIGRLSSSSSPTRVCEFIRRKNLDDVSQEERKIIANLVKNRADDILFGEQGQRILKPLSNYNRKLDTRRDLRLYTKKLLGQEFLQEDELLNFWLNGDDSPTWDLYRIAKKYTQIDDSFGKNGNIVPTEDFIRFYIYSRGEYDNCFDDFLSEESPTRLAIESPDLKAKSSYINHNVLYYYGDNRDLRLLNFAEHRDIFDDLCSDSELGENSTRCLLEANLYNVDNAKYLKNIASLGDYSAIKYAMDIFNEDPDIYGDRLEVVNEIVKSPNFHFIDGISRKKFDISNEALQVYDGIDPDSNTAIIIYQLFEKNKNFDLYYRDKDLINELDGLDKSLVRAVVSLIENNDLADNLDKIRSLNDSKNVKIIADIAVNDLEFAIAISEEADRIDPNMIDIVHDVYLSTKKVEIDKTVEIFEATKNMYSDIVDYKSGVSKNIIHSLLEMDGDYIDALKKIDKVYSSSEVPEFIKRFASFKILFPDAKKSDIDSESSGIRSPALKNASKAGLHEAVLFSDMLKIAIDSNDPSIRRYLNNIKDGQSILSQIENGELNFSELDSEQTSQLEKMFKSLDTTYKISKKGKEMADDRHEDLEQEYQVLRKYYGVNEKHNLSERLVRWFSPMAFEGEVKTVEDILKEMDDRNSYFDAKNREFAKEGHIEIKAGDFVKGTNKEEYVIHSITKGAVCKEMLGCGDDETDFTPLDTDLSRIQEDSSFDGLTANRYGPYYLYIKGDDVDTSGKCTWRDVGKIEAFQTGVLVQDHWGIRTGIGSGYISAIMTDQNHHHLTSTIAKRGVYIPITDMSGEVKFTPEQYDKLREKMRGMSYYGEDLEKPVIKHYSNERIEKVKAEKSQDLERIARQKTIIEKAIIEAIQQDANIKEFDGSISGGVEIIDIGSTGRGTNLPGDGDYDYMIRVDRTIINDSPKLNAIKQHIHQAVGGTNEGGEHLRIKGASIDGEKFDFDATFAKMNISLQYSTDMAISERLNNIKKYNPEEYENVIANIVVAKQILKEANAYKKGTHGQGGLGGVGVENWILQNNGSLEAAAREFLESAKGRNFDEFKDVYKIYDFGQNHVSIERDQGIVYNEFVYDNMTPQGYEAMRDKLSKEFPEIWKEILDKK